MIVPVLASGRGFFNSGTEYMSYFYIFKALLYPLKLESVGILLTTITVYRYQIKNKSVLFLKRATHARYGEKTVLIKHIPVICNKQAALKTITYFLNFKSKEQ